MEIPVRVEDVWKSYGRTAAVCGLSLCVPRQSVYGFLGPNGAGKSTTIRMMLGLQRPDRGAISLFGSHLSTRVGLLKRAGSLVEAPSLYSHLTGRENLEVHRRLLGLPFEGLTLDEFIAAVWGVGSQQPPPPTSGAGGHGSFAVASLNILLPDPVPQRVWASPAA